MVHTPHPPNHTGGITHSNSYKVEALAGCFETNFQPVTEPSVQAFTKMADLALRSYFQTPASETNLTNPEEVSEAIMGVKFSKYPNRNCTPRIIFPSERYTSWPRFSILFS
jgi:hypothetical protein